MWISGRLVKRSPVLRSQWHFDFKVVFCKVYPCCGITIVECIYRFGISRVYSQQCGFVLADAQMAQNNIKALLKVIRTAELDPNAGEARYDARCEVKDFG